MSGRFDHVDHYAPVRIKADCATARATRLLTSDNPDRTRADRVAVELP